MPLCPWRMNLIGGVGWFYPHFSTTCEFSVDPPSFIFGPQFHSSQKVLPSFDQQCACSQMLGGGFKHIFCCFHPETWGDEPILTSIFFQTGWFNHQVEYSTKKLCFVPPLSWWCFLFSRILQGKKKTPKPESDNSTTSVSFCGNPQVLSRRHWVSTLWWSQGWKKKVKIQGLRVT